MLQSIIIRGMISQGKYYSISYCWYYLLISNTVSFHETKILNWEQHNIGVGSNVVITTLRQVLLTKSSFLLLYLMIESPRKGLPLLRAENALRSMPVLDTIKGMGNSTLRVLVKIMYFVFLRFSASPLDFTQIVRFSMRTYSSLTIISLNEDV